MFGKDVVIEYNGVKFKVFVTCIPETSAYELQNRALEKLLKAFELYGISIV